MSSLDEREAAFEKKYAHDAEMQFKAEARRNKLLGMWAAVLMEKSPPEAEAYAMEVVADEETIRAKMAELMILAKDAILNEAE